MTLEYELYGRPLSWSRAGSKGSQRFTPSRVRVAQSRHREAAELARPDNWPLDALYSVRVVAHMPSAICPDVDNLAKLVMDALQGTAYTNDAQVVRLVVERRLDRSEPRTEVSVRILPEGE